MFADDDRALFDAMLSRLLPPAGFPSWEAWFAHDAAQLRPRDTRSDAEVVRDIERKRGRTALHDAAAAGDLARVEALLAGGADPNAVFRSGDLRWTPLCAAVQKDCIAVVRALLSAGASVAGSYVEPAILQSRSVAVAELLVAHGARFDEEDARGHTVFARVIDTCGDVELARFLAARTPPPSAAQRAVLERVMRQTSEPLRQVALAFLAAPSST